MDMDFMVEILVSGSGGRSVLLFGTFDRGGGGLGGVGWGRD
jgi:hypothetical protein